MSELIAGSLCQAIWPFFNIYSVAADSVFKIPFWRHFIAWMGSVPAGHKNFKRVLGMGNVAVIVGGIAGGCKGREGVWVREGGAAANRCQHAAKPAQSPALWTRRVASWLSQP
jgi:1-acyl-sn-glycerol-3-phosphate acyltransferase